MRFRRPKGSARQHHRAVASGLGIVLFVAMLWWSASAPVTTPTLAPSSVTVLPHTTASDESGFEPILDLLLPNAQLQFDPNVPLTYQMHNCLRGRDGSKFGLKDAGFVQSQNQRESGNVHSVYDDAQVIVSCNNVKPARQVSNDPRVNGKRLVSTSVGIVEEGCLGGGKKDQLVCRRALATLFGCEYDSLGIQPRQYLLSLKSDCTKILTRAQHEPSRPWLLKPSASLRGRGIKYFGTSQSLLEDISDCESEFHVDDIIQEYVVNPALLNGFKFDVRTWMLIASIDPLVLFYREGFARVANAKYEEASQDTFAHITNLEGQQQKRADHTTYLRSFDEVQQDLHETYGFPKDYMKQGAFKRQIMRAHTFAALAQFLPEPAAMDNRKGFYHLFACDSVVGQDQQVHLLECNGFPAESQQVLLEKRVRIGKQADPQLVWKEMISLVLNLHLDPDTLLPDNSTYSNSSHSYRKQGWWKTPPVITGKAFGAKHGYRYGSWDLAFNELETPFSSLNACEVDFMER
ncbi:hypothetical protein BASA81_001957 [Batrachochytrium salamandrivorans]|nr:hypothetical protein BASA81_001957 [Batrachochytrium salamandrivorans]